MVSWAWPTAERGGAGTTSLAAIRAFISCRSGNPSSGPSANALVAKAPAPTNEQQRDRTTFSCDYLHRRNAWAMRSLPRYGLRARCRLKRIGRRILHALDDATSDGRWLHSRVPIPPFRCRAPPLAVRASATLMGARTLDDESSRHRDRCQLSQHRRPRNLRCSWGFIRTHRLPQHGTKARPHDRVLSIRFFAGTWRQLRTLHRGVMPDAAGSVRPIPILARYHDGLASARRR